MGFYITDENKVCIDHTIKDFGETTADRNPTYDFTQCQHRAMRITSVFKRYGYDGKGKPIGDNCPWIYGVKRKQNLIVSYSGVKPLVAPFQEIISKFATDCAQRGMQFDVIIPMPSSHRIASVLARRTSEALGKIPIEQGVFLKSTSQDVQNMVDGTDIPRGAKINIVNAISKAAESGKAFSLSDVKPIFRQYVSPVSLVPGQYTWRNILLVDDLYATGQTLIAAKEALFRDLDGLHNVESLCLFSPLNGRIRNKDRKPRGRRGGR